MPSTRKMFPRELIDIEVTDRTKRDFDHLLFFVFNEDCGKVNVFYAEAIVYKAFGVSFFKVVFFFFLTADKGVGGFLFFNDLKVI